jgi:hypothetical protein
MTFDAPTNRHRFQKFIIDAQIRRIGTDSAHNTSEYGKSSQVPTRDFTQLTPPPHPQPPTHFSTIPRALTTFVRNIVVLRANRLHPPHRMLYVASMAATHSIPAPSSSAMSATTIFDPHPALADAVIDALSDPDTTLRSIALRFNTTLESLTRWMQRLDIAARLDAIEQAIARRARLLATNYLPSIVTHLITTLDNAQSEEAHPTQPASTDLKTLDLRRRAREASRKAAGLLARLARFIPAKQSNSSSSPPARRRPHQSTPTTPITPTAQPATLHRLASSSPQPGPQSASTPPPLTQAPPSYNSTA